METKTELQIQLDRLMQLAKKIIETGNSIYGKHYCWKKIIDGVDAYYAVENEHLSVKIGGDSFNKGIEIQFHPNPTISTTILDLSEEKIKELVDKHESDLSKFIDERLSDAIDRAKKDDEKEKIILKARLAELEK
jgi:hypothetical protein